MLDLSVYAGREQTYVKHFILERCLERFAHIIGYHWKTLAYVDCFSGPWQSKDAALRDTSFSIAVEAFRKARADLASLGRTPQVRCLFLEKTLRAFRQLSTYADGVTDLDARAIRGKLEDSIKQIEDFVREAGPDTFTSSSSTRPAGRDSSLRPLLRCCVSSRVKC